MPKQASTRIVLVLAAATALGPLAVNVYLPALPAIGEALGAGTDQVQLTLSLYLIGFALAQLLCGPLSDRYGRKPVLLGGMATFAAASVLCAFAPTIESLLAGRVIQALGGAIGPVLGRAAVRDLYEPPDAGRILSYMASTMALAPAVAPVGGAILLSLYGWGATFLFLAGYAVLMVLVIALLLPEPLPLARRQSLGIGVILRNFRMLLGERAFIGYTLTNAAAQGGMFAFLSGSSFVLIDFLEVSPTLYGVLFGVGAGGFLCGTLAAARFNQTLGTDRLIIYGAALCVTGGVVMAALAWCGVFEVFAITVPHIVFMAGVGILMPHTMAGAIAPFPYCAGSASSLFGFIQMTSSAAIGAAVGQLHDGSSRTMATAMAIAGLLALASHLLLIRPARLESRLGRNAPPAK